MSAKTKNKKKTNSGKRLPGTHTQNERMCAGSKAALLTAVAAEAESPVKKAAQKLEEIALAVEMEAAKAAKAPARSTRQAATRQQPRPTGVKAMVALVKAKLGQLGAVCQLDQVPCACAKLLERTPDCVKAPFRDSKEYVALTATRIRRAKRERRAKRFPESDSWPVQVFLLVSGVLPAFTGRVRAAAWRLRRRSIDFYGRLFSRAERKKLHPLAFLGGAVAIASFALFLSLYTYGTTVAYDGKVIGTLSSVTAAEEACAKLELITSATLGDSFTIDAQLIQYSQALVSRDSMVDPDTLEEELSDEIGLVTYGYSLYVDGELIGATPYDGALEELLAQLKEAVMDADTISCTFEEDVEIKPEYVPTEKILNLGYIAEILNSTKAGEVIYTVVSGDTWSQIAERHGLTSQELLALNPGYDINRIAIDEVLTISNAVPYLTMTLTQRERYVENVPFDIEYEDTASLYQGDYKVLSEGVYGQADVVANVTYVNGEEVQRDILSHVTLSNPVTELQSRGTKERPTWLPTGSFRWPCSGNITSRYGYRNLSYSRASKNHKGIDIANRYGTAIYAADGGTVTYAGWMSGYGYLVQIDHGNGFVTYYGHNSSLLVSRGQKVYKGQQVARMGSTGNSTGNHCHFEVRYNGVEKNPFNYLP